MNFDFDNSGAVDLNDANNYTRMCINSTTPATPVDVIATSGWSAGTTRFKVRAIEGNAIDALKVVVGLPPGNLGDTATYGNHDVNNNLQTGLWISGATVGLMKNGASFIAADTDGAVSLNVTTVTASGDITSQGTITSTSDIRVKTNITKIEDALSKVEQLNGYTFDRTDSETSRQTGVIAQEVLKVLPEAVLGSEDTTYSVAYGNMMGLMIEAIKELNAKVVDLQNQLANK